MAAIAVVAILAGDALAQEAPTVVRRDHPACLDARAAGDLSGACVCAPGVLCLTRPEMERATVAIESEGRLRQDLKACRENPVEVETGWPPWKVAVVVVAVAAGALAVGFGVGYGLHDHL
jgi:hypothetical protein